MLALVRNLVLIGSVCSMNAQNLEGDDLLGFDLGVITLDKGNYPAVVMRLEKKGLITCLYTYQDNKIQYVNGTAYFLEPGIKKNKAIETLIELQLEPSGPLIQCGDSWSIAIEVDEPILKMLKDEYEKYLIKN